MARLAETCPSCGEYNKAELPAYVWALGGLIVLLLMLALGDLGAVVRVVGEVLGWLRRPGAGP